MVDMFDLKEKSIKAVVSVERYLHRTRHRVLGKLDKIAFQVHDALFLSLIHI